MINTKILESGSLIWLENNVSTKLIFYLLICVCVLGTESRTLYMLSWSYTSSPDILSLWC
jgi:hypothetical protein